MVPFSWTIVVRVLGAKVDSPPPLALKLVRWKIVWIVRWQTVIVSLMVLKQPSACFTSNSSTTRPSQPCQLVVAVGESAITPPSPDKYVDCFPCLSLRWNEGCWNFGCLIFDKITRLLSTALWRVCNIGGCRCHEWWRWTMFVDKGQAEAKWVPFPWMERELGEHLLCKNPDQWIIWSDNLFF